MAPSAASHGPSSGTLVVNYTDGTSPTQTVTLGDWAKPQVANDTAVATMSYRNNKSGVSQSITTNLWVTTVPVAPSKTVASITLPSVSNTVTGSMTVTAMHIFAIGLG
jgi:hypothetical protein